MEKVQGFTFTERDCKMSKTYITNNIRKLRFFNDEMTQKALADAVGVTRQTIVAIEKGNYSPSLELAFKIAHVFDQPIGEVFFYDTEAAKSKSKK